MSANELKRTSAFMLPRVAGIGLAAVAVLGLATGSVSAQTYGYATLPPGSLSHSLGAAIAKVLKEKGGINVLVQPTAGDTVILPMVNSGEANLGNGNVIEVQRAYDGAAPGGKKTNLRLVASMHTLHAAFWVRKTSPMRTIADLRGKRVVTGYSAMPTMDLMTNAILAAGGLTVSDVNAVPVPNVVRGADDFVAGASDMYFFAFGAPKVREVEATVGGTRVLEIDDQGMAAARKILKWTFLTPVTPGPIYVGVTHPMKVYSFDNMIYTSAKESDDFIYKVLDTLVKNKDELVTLQPLLRGFPGYRQYDMPYHPGAVRYYKDHNIQAAPLP
jgi:TRAP transporter TAXI family solute receptor